MLTLLLLSCAVALVMLIWFNSDAVIEYGSLIGLKSVLDVDEFFYQRIRLAPDLLSYPTFLKTNHNMFVTRLLGCKLCFCVAFSILTTVLVSPWLIAPVCILSLILYGVITKLLDFK